MISLADAPSSHTDQFSTQYNADETTGWHCTLYAVANETIHTMRRRSFLAARAIAVMTGAFVVFALVAAAFSSSPTWIEEPTFWSAAPCVIATATMTIFVVVRDLLSDQTPKE